MWANPMKDRTNTVASTRAFSPKKTVVTDPLFKIEPSFYEEPSFDAASPALTNDVRKNLSFKDQEEVGFSVV